MARLLLAVLTCLAGSVLAAGFPKAPAIHGDQWLNSAPLAAQELRGKVVLLEFWTFGCWNCKNVEPYIKQWHATYGGQGLLVLAVHSPEFPHEAKLENVQRYIRENGLQYPVPVDNDFVTWRRFGNRAWPALYLIDKAGQIRYTHVGEGGYAATEKAIRTLLAEPGTEVPVNGRLRQP